MTSLTEIFVDNTPARWMFDFVAEQTKTLQCELDVVVEELLWLCVVREMDEKAAVEWVLEVVNEFFWYRWKVKQWEWYRRLMHSEYVEVVD